ncbi:MAG: hypothetical protein IH849_08045 [Acidobacteria bacterium]|nr:hypothetical protein [Acidobacteriota bacterium]
MRDTVLCVASLAIASTLIGWGAPAPYIECIDDKLDLLARRRASINAVFIGSSRVHHNYVPQVFDDEMARRGVEARSLNFGAPGMRLIETHYLLQRMSETGLRLDWVLVEIDDFSTPVLNTNRDSTRETYWHDLEHTSLALRSLVFESNAAASRGGTRVFLTNLGHAAGHLRAFVQRRLNIGAFPRAFDPSSERLTDTDAMCLGPGGDGFEPLPLKPGTGEVAAAHEASLAQRLDEFYARLDTTEPTLDDGARRYRIAMLRSIRQLAESMGATVIFVVSPLPVDHRATIELIREENLGQLFAFSDRKEYSTLVSERMMFDWTHLNFVGAEAFSRALAGRLAAAAGAGQ